MIESKRLMAPYWVSNIPNETIHDRGLRADRSEDDWIDLEVVGNWTQDEFIVEGMEDDLWETGGW